MDNRICKFCIDRTERGCRRGKCGKTLADGCDLFDIHDSFKRLPDVHVDIYKVAVNYKGISVIELYGEALAKVMNDDGSLSKQYKMKVFKSPLMYDPSVRSYCDKSDVDETIKILVSASENEILKMQDIVNGVIERFNGVKGVINSHKLGMGRYKEEA